MHRATTYLLFAAINGSVIFQRNTFAFLFQVQRQSNTPPAGILLFPSPFTKTLSSRPPPPLIKKPCFSRSKLNLSQPKSTTPSPVTTTNTEITIMPRGVKKENLPSKICVICHRPFNWRKKWERVWDEVTTCSKSCNRKRKADQRRNNSYGDKGDNTIDAVVKCTGEELDVSENEYETVTQNEFVNEVFFERLKPYNYDGDEDNNNNSSQNDLTKLISEPGNNLDIDSEVGSTCSQTSHQDKDSMDTDIDSNLTHQLQLQLQQNNDPFETQKFLRKAAKKQQKALRRQKREGRADPSVGQKPCDICTKSVDLLIRCTTDSSETWRMVCGQCWKGVSGGVVDGDADHPYYRYGGLWKNRKRV